MAANQAYQADKLAKGSKVQKATVTLKRKLDGYSIYTQQARMLKGICRRYPAKRILISQHMSQHIIQLGRLGISLFSVRAALPGLLHT